MVKTVFLIFSGQNDQSNLAKELSFNGCHIHLFSPQVILDRSDQENTMLGLVELSVRQKTWKELSVNKNTMFRDGPACN